LRPWQFIIYIVVALLGFSIVAVYSTDKTTFVLNGNGYQFTRHLLWMVIGMAVLFSMSVVDYHHLQKLSWPVFIISLILLLLVLIPGIGTVMNGARRWIRINNFIGIQPSELAKVSAIIFISYYVANNHKVMASFKKGFLIPLSIVTMMSGLILMEPDFGTAAFIIILSVILLIAGGMRIIFVCFTTLAAVPFIYELIYKVPYRRMRLFAFMDPWQDPYGTGYHVIQSWIALGSGGLTGLGLGNSRQKLFFLPESSSDFIFTVIGEEFGFLGCVTVITLFSLLLWQGLKIVNRTKDLFGFFLGLGIILMFGLQAIINIAVVSGIIPTKGIPLPLVSTGGSSLLLSMLCVGILVNIAKQSEVRETETLMQEETCSRQSINDRFFPVRIFRKISSRIGSFSW